MTLGTLTNEEDLACFDVNDKPRVLLIELLLAMLYTTIKNKSLPSSRQWKCLFVL